MGQRSAHVISLPLLELAVVQVMHFMTAQTPAGQLLKILLLVWLQSTAAP